jgi:transposase
VTDAVVVAGTPLIDDPHRVGAVSAVGLDETLFARKGPFRRQWWSTQIADVAIGQLLDIVAGRDAVEPCRGFAAQPERWRAGIAWATLDLSASHRTVFATMLLDAIQVADPFHVVRVANTALDECRRGCRTKRRASGPPARPALSGPAAADHRRRTPPRRVDRI